MIRRRPLYATLTEIAGGLVEATASLPVRTRSIDLTLPLDIRLPGADGDLTGDLPLFRLRTAFDPEPAWLHIVFSEVTP